MASSATCLYLNELISEMRQLSETAVEFKNAQFLLSKEIAKVYDKMHSNSLGSMEHLKYGSEFLKNGCCSPQRNSGFSCSSPYSSTLSTSLNTSASSFVTPIKSRRSPCLGDYRTPLGESSRESTPLNEALFVLQTKIYIPTPPSNLDGRKIKCSYVGRILGPSGMSARNFENEYDVTLLIRGSGSVRHVESEETLKGKKGYEHLNEPLHVVLIARHNDKKKCEEILERAAQKIESLLTPVHDDYKRDQLIRYAMLNGTYYDKQQKKSK